MQGAEFWLLSVCMLVPITWLNRHAFEVATAFRREENSPPVEIPFGTKISTGLVIFLFLFFFFFNVSWVTWLLAVFRAKKPGDARSLTQKKPPSRCPTNTMVSSPQIVENIVLFWSLLWKHPRISFTWLENMSTHTKGLAMYCAPHQSVWACVCMCMCVRVHMRASTRECMPTVIYYPRSAT